MIALLFLLLVSQAFAESGSVQAPCNPTQTGFQVSSWPPSVSGSYQYFYYEVRTTSSCYTPLSQILLNLPGCKDCLSLDSCEGSIQCYDSYWRTLSRCPYSFSWQTTDPFYLSKGYSVSGVKFSVNIYSRKTFRFSIKVPRSYSVATGSLWVRGKYFSQCSVPVPVCTCGTCPRCPTASYLSNNSSCTCTPCSNCTSNSYEVSPCGPTSNRICKSCTNCVVGTYESKTCDSISDRVCKNCTICTGEQYETRMCTLSQDRICNNCTTCIPDVTYQARQCNSYQNRVCYNCSSCIPGISYQVSPCNVTHNRVCSNCTVCANGTFEISPCTATSDRVCTPCSPCPAGTYEVSPCNGTSPAVCQSCSPCPAGTWEQSPCTPTSNSVCQNCSTCPVGTWMERPCNATHDTVCRNCTVCGVDEQEVAPCTDTTDTVCVPCLVCATCPNNSRLTNNGLNCTCNDGFVQDPSAVNFTCIPAPCCADCFSCNFNGSATCASHDSNLCDFTCRESGPTCGSGSSQGWSVALLSVTYNNTCCLSDGCSCFLYNISNGNGLGIEEFVLGLSCNDIFLCAPGGSVPCLYNLQPVDSENTLPGIGGVDPPPFIDPRTGIRGIRVTGLAIGPGNSWTTINIQFLGEVAVSPLPVPYTLFGNADLNSPCFVSDVSGPDCVQCP